MTTQRSKCCDALAASFKKTYARDYSHEHCWNQRQPCACGIPLDKHTQCCLCDMKYPANASAVEKLRKEFEKKFHVIHMTNAASITPSSDPYNWTEFNNGDERELPDDIFNWFLTRASTLSDTTLRTVLDEAEKSKLHKARHTNDQNIYNAGVSAVIKIINKHITAKR